MNKKDGGADASDLPAAVTGPSAAAVTPAAEAPSPSTIHKKSESIDQSRDLDISSDTSSYENDSSTTALVTALCGYEPLARIVGGHRSIREYVSKHGRKVVAPEGRQDGIAMYIRHNVPDIEAAPRLPTCFRFTKEASAGRGGTAVPYKYLRGVVEFYHTRVSDVAWSNAAWYFVAWREVARPVFVLAFL